MDLLQNFVIFKTEDNFFLKLEWALGQLRLPPPYLDLWQTANCHSAKQSGDFFVYGWGPSQLDYLITNLTCINSMVSLCRKKFRGHVTAMTQGKAQIVCSSAFKFSDMEILYYLRIITSSFVRDWWALPDQPPYNAINHDPAQTFLHGFRDCWQGMYGSMVKLWFGSYESTCPTLWF